MFLVWVLCQILSLVSITCFNFSLIFENICIVFFFDLQVFLDDSLCLILWFSYFVSFLVFHMHFRIISVYSLKIFKFGVLHVFLFLKIFKNMFLMFIMIFKVFLVFILTFKVFLYVLFVLILISYVLCHCCVFLFLH